MSKFVDEVWFEIEECCNCGMPFAVTTDFKNRRLKDHKSFYCPMGHGQHYTGETEEQNLRRQLSREREKASQAETGRHIAEQRLGMQMRTAAKTVDELIAEIQRLAKVVERLGDDEYISSLNFGGSVSSELYARIQYAKDNRRQEQ